MEGDRAVKKQKMSALEQLKKHTVIVADTGDFEGKFLNVIYTNKYRTLRLYI